MERGQFQAIGDSNLRLCIELNLLWDCNEEEDGPMSESLVMRELTCSNPLNKSERLEQVA